MTGHPTLAKPEVVFFLGQSLCDFFPMGARGRREGGEGGVGRCSASRLTDQHPDKSHHEIRLYASYRAENWSIHIKTITCNVWNQSKPFKIASNISFDTKNTPKSSKISKNHKNQFLQYLSTRNFMENSNLMIPGLICIDKS